MHRRQAGRQAGKQGRCFYCVEVNAECGMPRFQRIHKDAVMNYCNAADFGMLKYKVDG